MFIFYSVFQEPKVASQNNTSNLLIITIKQAEKQTTNNYKYLT